MHAYVNETREVETAEAATEQAAGNGRYVRKEAEDREHLDRESG